MMARVASRGETHAVLVIAGMPVTAELPAEVQAGATLKLKVKEVSAERVWLQIDPQQPTAPTVAAAPAPMELRPQLAGRRRSPAAAAAPTASPPMSSRWPSRRPRWAVWTCAWSCAASGSWPK